MDKKILYVRGLSEAARQVLEREAEQAHRSLSAQIVTILEGHVKQEPYTCIDCGKPLDFPHSIFVGDMPYCSEHAPSYNKHDQW